MRVPALVLAAACVIALLLVGGKFLLSSGSFSPANPYWDGISSIALSGGAVPVYDFGQLHGAGPGCTLLVIGPSTGYTGEDARHVSDFMLDGGRAIVMDDYGTANSLLEGLGSPIEVGRVPLCQDVDYYRSPSLPVVSGISCHAITRNVSCLAFNHPVPLNLSAGATPVAGTSARAWLDPDDNGTFDGAETFGAYTLIAAAGYGKGELVVAGDADLLINGMLDKGDNGVLLDNLREGGTVYVDAGHGQHMPPLASLFFVIKHSVAAQAACVAAIAVLACGYALWRRPRGSKAEAAGRDDSKRSLLAGLRKLPLSERELRALNKKL